MRLCTGANYWSPVFTSQNLPISDLNWSLIILSGNLKRSDKIESEEQYVLHSMPASSPICGLQVLPCLPGTGASTRPPAAVPVPLWVRILSGCRCAVLDERGFLTGRPLMLEGKGEGDFQPGVCTDVCLRVFHRGKQEGDGKGSREMSVTDPSLRLFRRDGGWSRMMMSHDGSTQGPGSRSGLLSTEPEWRTVETASGCESTQSQDGERTPGAFVCLLPSICCMAYNAPARQPNEAWGECSINSLRIGGHSCLECRIDQS